MYHQIQNINKEIEISYTYIHTYKEPNRNSDVEMENSLGELKRQCEQAKERISNLEDRSIAIIQSQEQKEKE